MKRYFTTEDDAETKLVKVYAVKRGTISGRYGIFHMDPKGKDPRARSRSVRPEIADELVRKGIAKRSGAGSASTTGDNYRRPLGEVAASRRGTSIEKNGEETRTAEYFGSNGADTRDTTAFETDPSKSARTNPFRVITLGERREPDEDDDDGGEGEGEEGDHDDAQTGTETTGVGSTGSSSSFAMSPADEVLGQEGNAGGADAPPSDEMGDRLPAGSDATTGGNATDGSGAPTDATDDGTKIVANQPASTQPAAAPRARRAPRTPASE